MYSEVFYDMFHRIFISCNLWAIKVSFTNIGIKKLSNLTTDRKNLKNSVHEVTSNEYIRKIVLSSLSIRLKKCFKLLYTNMLMLFGQYYCTHKASAIWTLFFCKIFTQAFFNQFFICFFNNIACNTLASAANSKYIVV